MPARSGAVHVATTRRHYNGKTYETHLLRRTYREAGKVKHETLGNLSHLPTEIISAVTEMLKGVQYAPVTDVFKITESLPHGQVEAVLGTIRKIGLDSLIDSRKGRERDLVVGMIAERVIHPSSKLATTRSWKTTTLAEELEVEDAGVDELYQAMDWLLERKERIEKKLAKRHLREGGAVLYDVSSSYYEGQTCSLVQYGYSRDRKRGLPIVVYGVMTNGEGCPVSVDTYSGKTGDPTTVPDQVNKIANKFGLERAVIVGDRGMLTDKQIAAIREEQKLGWISALKSTAIRKLVEDGELQMSLFDQLNIAEINSTRYPGERLVVCYNPLLNERRAKTREGLLEATTKELDRIKREVARRKKKPLTKEAIALKAGKVIGKFKVGKHFTLEMDDGKFDWKKNEAVITREEQLDGIYVIRTSEAKESMNMGDVVRGYKGLAAVEKGFRCLKGPDLRVRPIFHRTEDHVKAHIFICFLAYYVEWHMRKALAELTFSEEQLDQLRSRRDPVAPAEPSDVVKQKKNNGQTQDGLEVQSFQTLMHQLSTRCRNRCKIDTPGGSAHQFTRLTEMTPLQARAMNLLGL